MSFYGRYSLCINMSFMVEWKIRLGFFPFLIILVCSFKLSSQDQKLLRRVKQYWIYFLLNKILSSEIWLLYKICPISLYEEVVFGKKKKRHGRARELSSLAKQTWFQCKNLGLLYTLGDIYYFKISVSHNVMVKSGVKFD